MENPPRITSKDPTSLARPTPGVSFALGEGYSLAGGKKQGSWPSHEEVEAEKRACPLLGGVGRGAARVWASAFYIFFFIT